MKRIYQTFSSILLMTFVLASGYVSAQDKTVSGQVTSADDGQGVPGVNVVVVGTSQGTTTDFDGNYSLSVPDGAVLSFSFVGFTTQEIAVGNQSVINVILQSDVTALAEIVVTGYGTQSKREITSAVASVKSEDFNQGNVVDPAQLLQGKVAGLDITKTGGNPHGGYTIRLRGLSTIGANSEPLIVIDGVIGGQLENVDPNDIASMDVLKDASAAAIYGTRGSSGVILITTKKGKAGQNIVEYNGYVTTESVFRRIPVLDAAGYSSLPGSVDYGTSTNWLDEITRTGVSQYHNIALSGGSGNTSYRASVNYRDVEGIQRTSGFQQLNARVALSQKALNDKLTVDVNLYATNRKATFGRDEAFRYAAIYNPTAPVRSSDPEFDTYDGYFQKVAFDFYNPVAIIEQSVNDGEDKLLNLSARAEYEVLDGLSFNAFYSIQTENRFRGEYIFKNNFWRGKDSNGFASRSIDDSSNQLFELGGRYDTQFDDLNFAFVGGYSYQDFSNEGFGASAGDVISDAFLYNSLADMKQFNEGLGNVYSYKNSHKLIAFFGRAVFNYDDKYFATIIGRYEGSTRFGENNKWGFFPGVSAGADIKQIADLDAFGQLKFRVSYGETGNIPGQSYLSELRLSQQGSGIINGEFSPGYAPAVNANPDLRWETRKEFDIGVDFSMVNDRLYGSLDWYTKTTSDFIIQQAVSVPPNVADRTWLNGGEFTNTGVELALNYDAFNNPDGFNWTTSIVFGTFDTQIQSLASGEAEQFYANVGSPGQNNTFMIKAEVGQPVGNIWGLQFEGLDGDGRWVFTDVNGDELIDDNDRVIIGNGLPDFTIGWNNQFKYKSFDVSMYFRGAFGHDIINQYRTFYESITEISKWNAVESINDVPGLTEAPIFSDLMVEKGDYFMLDNLTVGYNMPLDAGALFRQARFYVTGQNLFMITGYRGADPAVRYGDSEDSGNPLAPGIDRRNTWVMTRGFTFGVNLKF
jgi:iron complex outermembrane receptor protein